ncbi:MAG: Plug domain-containing protein, partial [Gemmatimonadota bacterium]|nr:Plug domain-containing protein [Gemmatimonadota bacterium]
DSTKANLAARGDTTTAKPAAGADTTKVDAATARRRRLAADTVKAPLARAEMPVEPATRWHWRGEELRAAGAVTLADLLAKVPGATAFRANWIPAPQFIAYNGDVGRVRVFRDGVELDAIDPRNGQVLDLGLVSLWQFEEVGVERAPGELRVHMRSWRVDRTIPLTRTEVITGSENTNLYRGFFGRRFHNGAAVQLAAQQMSTTSPRTGGDGTSLQVFARVGWAWRRLSVDGAWHRASLDRAATIRFPLLSELTLENGTPAFKGNYGSGYGRIAWGDPDAKGAPWVQVIASSQMIAENSKVSETTSLTIPTAAPKDTVDTATSRTQYVVAAGASRWGVRASVAARLRAGQGRTDVSPTLRLGYDWRFVSLAGFAESRGADSTQRLDLTARVAPWRWLVLTGAHGSYTPKSPITGGPKFTGSRVELESTLFGVTVSGGLLMRGLATVAAPVAIDSSLVRVGTGEVKGVAFAVRTNVWRDIALDVSGVRWESSGVYRPQMEIHSALFVDTSFPNRFPRNNFHLFASVTHNHRTPMFFPTNDGKVGQSTGPVDAIGARLEIRIESGTIFFQTENMVGKIYDTAPGYMMPRRLQYYGLRWDFWN